MLAASVKNAFKRNASACRRRRRIFQAGGDPSALLSTKLQKVRCKTYNDAQSYGAMCKKTASGAVYSRVISLLTANVGTVPAVR